jgi:AraC-like DNA-binding protein
MDADDDASLDRALADILHSVRLESALLSRACLHAPFGVASSGVGRPIFHAVARGSIVLRRVADGEDHRLERGDVAVLTRGDAHVISDAPDRVVVPLATLPVTRTRSQVAQVGVPDEADASVLCGSFGFQHAAGEAMLGLLPPVVVVRERGGEVVGWLAQTLTMLDAELDRDLPGSTAMVTRLVDLLVAHVLRRAVLDAPLEAGGWLCALRDPKIGRALAEIHRRPDHDWTASSLAGAIGMSRSAFFARFSELVGEPPAQYLTRWRMQVAADLMGDGQLSLGQLAQRVGYGSEDAFSKMFKRHMGCSPGAYRRQLRA